MLTAIAFFVIIIIVIKMLMGTRIRKESILEILHQIRKGDGMKHALTVYSFLCLPLVILCIASVSLIGYYFDKMKFGWASPWAGYVLAAGLSYWVLGFAKKAYLKYYTKFEKVMA